MQCNDNCVCVYLCCYLTKSPYFFIISGGPTNFGLQDSLSKKWEIDDREAGLGNYGTTYGSSFITSPQSALVTNHYAPPKALSTRILPVNKINKDLGLRSVNVIQTPEQVLMPSRMPTAATNISGLSNVSV